MSDLNDFFAKKDRKKKKAASKSAAAAPSVEVKPAETNNDSDRALPVAPQPKQDDGWIEIEDPKGSQVNTGGRTIVEFRRDAEEKETNADGSTQTEKFSGWGKVSQDAPPDTTESAKAVTAQQAPRSAFPTLADAAKVKTPAATISKPAPSSGVSIPSRRPRFTNSQPEKLRERLAQRAAMQPK